jgi:hypothetical protein
LEHWEDLIVLVSHPATSNSFQSSFEGGSL